MRDEAGRLGVIDFGDMLQAPLVQDLAVALAYLVPRGEGALGHAPSCVRAYGAMLPLTKLEQQLLPALTGARAALTLTIANWRAARNPHRADYILRNAPSAARALARLDAAGTRPPRCFSRRNPRTQDDRRSALRLRPQCRHGQRVLGAGCRFAARCRCRLGRSPPGGAGGGLPAILPHPGASGARAGLYPMGCGGE
ncbi:hypothetical protein [Acidocella sp. MX-AZ03]|uniref:hypothetical protein n=1 Tax=Acidocella sp. MX-AZ03 TaxID=2697363 RepID=UPI003FA40A87